MIANKVKQSGRLRNQSGKLFFLDQRTAAPSMGSWASDSARGGAGTHSATANAPLKATAPVTKKALVKLPVHSTR